jgi:hypothetical protein
VGGIDRRFFLDHSQGRSGNRWRWVVNWPAFTAADLDDAQARAARLIHNVAWSTFGLFDTENPATRVHKEGVTTALVDERNSHKTVPLNPESNYGKRDGQQVRNFRWNRDNHV